jgi:hypothetical protein
MGTPPVQRTEAYAVVRNEPSVLQTNGPHNSSVLSPYAVQVQGRSLLVPRTDFSRAVMGNRVEHSQTGAIPSAGSSNSQPSGRPLSNLSVLMQQQELAERTKTTEPASPLPQYPAMGPTESPTLQPRPHLGSSAPLNKAVPLLSMNINNCNNSPALIPPQIHRTASTGGLAGDRARR